MRPGTTVRGKITIGVGRNFPIFSTPGSLRRRNSCLPPTTIQCGGPWQTAPYAVLHGQAVAVPEVKFA